MNQILLATGAYCFRLSSQRPANIWYFIIYPWPHRSHWEHLTHTAYGYNISVLKWSEFITTIFIFWYLDNINHCRIVNVHFVALTRNPKSHENALFINTMYPIIRFGGSIHQCYSFKWISIFEINECASTNW